MDWKNENKIVRALEQKLRDAAHLEVDGKYYWIRVSSLGDITCVPVGGGEELRLHFAFANM